MMAQFQINDYSNYKRLYCPTVAWDFKTKMNHRSQEVHLINSSLLKSLKKAGRQFQNVNLESLYQKEADDNVI